MTSSLTRYMTKRTLTGCWGGNVRFTRQSSAYVSREEFNAVLEQLERALAAVQIMTGPGLECRKLPTGMTLSAISSPEVSGTPEALDETQGTQDTDTYDRKTDKVPVEFEVITDIQYDPSSHELSYRTRTITAVGLVSVSAESALTLITEAVPCPCT